MRDPYQLAEMTMHDLYNNPELTPVDLQALAGLLQHLATVKADAQQPAQKPAPELDTPGVTYRQEYVKCGKETCFCMTNPATPGHGPYWYAYWTEKGKTKKKYLGKTRRTFEPPREQSTTAAQAQPPAIAGLLEALTPDRQPVATIYRKLGWTRKKLEQAITQHRDDLARAEVQLHIATHADASGRREQYIDVDGTRYNAISRPKH